MQEPAPVAEFLSSQTPSHAGDGAVGAGADVAMAKTSWLTERSTLDAGGKLRILTRTVQPPVALRVCGEVTP